jgi:hypothetical protein
MSRAHWDLPGARTLLLDSIRLIASRKPRVCRSRRIKAAKEIGVARQPAHGRFRHAMLPIAWGVFGPHPDESPPRCLLAPHTSRERQIRSAPLARTRSSLSDAAADRIEVQYRNPLSRSRQNPVQQENRRNTTHQDSMKTHCPPYGSPGRPLGPVAVR